MALGFAVSWLAMLAHNLLELATRPPVDIENSGPLLVDLALLAAWRRPRSRGVQVDPRWALLSLVIGGVVTVLPLSVLLFVPGTVSRCFATIWSMSSMRPARCRFVLLAVAVQW